MNFVSSTCFCDKIRALNAEFNTGINFGIDHLNWVTKTYLKLKDRCR